jgi:E3 ubiquitin-protein ligase synoviolin
MTLRSFSKRITDYIRYQAATRDMHARYPDATAEELAPDNTCIVCREEMRPWAGAQAPGAAAQPGTTANERQRPKKLPCGHILHFSCLQSWLERQQSCPTCRGSVFAAPTVRGGQTPPPANGQVPAPGAAGPADAANPGANNPNPNPAAPPARRNNEGRVFRLGPLRLQFGGRLGGGRRDDQQELLDILARMARDRAGRPRNTQNANPGQVQVAPAQQPNTGAANGNLHPALRSATTALQLNVIEAQIRQEITALNLASERLNTVQALQAELDRLRNIQQAPPVEPRLSGFPIVPNQAVAVARGPQPEPSSVAGAQVPQQNLPHGLVLPPGWNLVPLTPVQQPPQPTRTSPAEAPSEPVVTGPSTTPTIPQSLSQAPTPTDQPSTSQHIANGAAVQPNGAIAEPSASRSPAAAPPTVPTSSWSFPAAGQESSKAAIPSQESTSSIAESSKQKQPSVEDANDD